MVTPFLKKLNAEYGALLADPKAMGKSAKAQLEDLNKALVEKKFTIKDKKTGLDKPFPTYIKPFIAERAMRAEFAKVTKTIMDCIEKVADVYFTRPEFKHYFVFPEIERELIAINPRYPRRVILARLDAFLTEKGIKFLEFNCDSPSGLGWHDELIKSYDTMPVVRKFSEKHPIKADTFLDSILATLLKKYKEFGGKDKPTIALMAKRDTSVRYDMDLIVDHFNRKGYKTVFADPRDCDYNGKNLTVNGTVIHAVYRDAISDFTDFMPEVKNFMKAYKDGNVCLMNPFASRVGGLKSVLALMTDERLASMFTQSEKDAIAKHIPWTRLMNEGRTNYAGKQVDLAEFIRKNKDKFVLKPNSGFGGFGVTIGCENDQKTWETAMVNAIEQKWTVQEVAEIPEGDFPDFDPELKLAPKKMNINFFAFDGDYPGGYVRVSNSSIINIHQGGGLVPMYYAENN